MFYEFWNIHLLYVVPQRASACISKSQLALTCRNMLQRASVCISVPQHASTFISVLQRTPACISVTQRASACLNMFKRDLRPCLRTWVKCCVDSCCKQQWKCIFVMIVLCVGKTLLTWLMSSKRASSVRHWTHILCDLLSNRARAKGAQPVAHTFAVSTAQDTRQLLLISWFAYLCTITNNPSPISIYLRVRQRAP